MRPIMSFSNLPGRKSYAPTMRPGLNYASSTRSLSPFKSTFRDSMFVNANGGKKGGGCGCGK